MKKTLLYVVVVILALIVLIYFLTPENPDADTSLFIRCKGNVAVRAFNSDRFWSAMEANGGAGGYSMKARPLGYFELLVLLQRGEDSIQTHLAILNMGADSIALRWQYPNSGGGNFFGKWRQRRRSASVRKIMDPMLLRMKGYLEHSENVYGLVMRDSMSKDSALLVSRFLTQAYPSTSEIYGYIGAIRKYAVSQGAHAQNYPMLHVEKTDTGYACLVGLSVDRELKGTDRILPKRYVPWKVVTAEVRGGAYSAEQGMKHLAEYIRDHSLAPQGLPFQSLMTERDREADTTRWVTWVVQAVP